MLLLESSALHGLGSGQARLELGVANCMAYCMGIILSGLQYLVQYRFSSYRVAMQTVIDHDDGNL